MLDSRPLHLLCEGLRPRTGADRRHLHNTREAIMALVDINWNPPPRDLRVFAVLQLIFFAIVAWLIQQRMATASLATTIVVGSVVVAVVGLIKPTWLRLMYVVWMAAVFPIGFVVSHLLMACVFYLVVTPIGLMMGLLGRDPMHRKLDRDAQTYWQARTPAKGTRGYFRQF